MKRSRIGAPSPTGASSASVFGHGSLMMAPETFHWRRNPNTGVMIINVPQFRRWVGRIYDLARSDQVHSDAVVFRARRRRSLVVR
jgi:hypothetical protein